MNRKRPVVEWDRRINTRKLSNKMSELTKQRPEIRERLKNAMRNADPSDLPRTEEEMYQIVKKAFRAEALLILQEEVGRGVG